MKSLKFIAPALLAGFMSFAMFSCSKSNDYEAPVVTDTTGHKINIRATQFDPNTLTSLPGIKITWTNVDTIVHSVVSDDGTSFNSGNISAGGTYTFTTSALGTIDYHCGIHPTVKGIIYVVNR